MDKPKRIAFFLVMALVCLFFVAGDCQDSTSTAGMQQTDNAGFLGMSEKIIGPIIAGLFLILSVAIVYILVQRRQLRQKDRELDQKDVDLELGKRKIDIEIQDRVEKREKEIEAKQTEVKRFTTFEQKYLNYLVQHHQWLKLQGLKTKEPVSVELKQVYVPLKAYRPGDRLPQFVGEEEIGPGIELIDDDKTVPKSRRAEYRRAERGRLDIAAVLREKTRIAIVGGPGCGKTTFLSYLALAHASGRHKEWLGVDRRRIPICISCKELKPASLPSSDDLHKWCLPELLKNDTPGDFFKKNLDEGACVILMDGLDEVATLQDRLVVIKWIREMAEVFHKNQFIVTSRIMGYEGAPMEAGFTEYYASDFDDDDRRRFIHAWYETVETTLQGRSDVVVAKAKADADNLYDSILRNDRIKRLAGIPLLLSIIAIVHRYAGRLPENRVKLYEECVDLLLGGKDEFIKFPLQFNSARKLVVLKPLAHFMHSKPTRILERDNLINQISPDLARVAGEKVSVDEFIEEVRLRSGLLVERGQQQFSFSHLTFQEYLTALYLKDQANADEILISHKDDPWWRETILLYCGMAPDISRFISRLLECREDVLLSNLRLAGYCVGESLGVDPRIRAALSSRLFDYFWSIQFSDLTDEIILALKPLAAHDESIAAKFGGKAKNESNSVRECAAWAMGQVGGESVVEQLVGLLKDTDSSVRVGAALALGQVGGEAVVGPLVELLKVTDSDVPWHAGLALGQVGGEAVVGPLLGLLNDNDNSVRRRAVLALGQVGGEVVVGPLLAILKDTDSSVRGNAAEALGKVGDMSVVGPLVRLLKDTESYVRGCAALALGQVGGEAAVGPLVGLLKESEWHVRSRAAYALGQVGGETVVGPLVGLLKDTESYVRGCAALALGQVGDETVVGPLVGLLKDPDNSVRGRAAAALGQVGGQAVVGPLVGLLKDTASSVRGSAALALGQVGGEAVVGPLVGLLKDTDLYARGRAAEALSKIGSSKIVDELVDRIDAQDESGNYICFKSLFGSLKKQSLYIDQLPAEVIERNAFWKENLKRNPVC